IVGCRRRQLAAGEARCAMYAAESHDHDTPQGVDVELRGSVLRLDDNRARRTGTASYRCQDRGSIQRVRNNQNRPYVFGFASVCVALSTKDRPRNMAVLHTMCYSRILLRRSGRQNVSSGTAVCTKQSQGWTVVGAVRARIALVLQSNVNARGRAVHATAILLQC